VINIFKLSSQEIDNTYFLLGMIDLYNPRIAYYKDKSIIECFATKDKLGNKLFYGYLLKLCQEKFRNEVILIDTTEQKATIYKNRKIRKYLNEYYITKTIELPIKGKNKWDVVKIQENTTEVQLNSYLTGAYARNGYRDSIGYHYRFANLFQKSEFIADLLPKKVNGLVEFRRCISCIPNVTIINFTFDSNVCDDQKINDFYKTRETLKKYLELIENNR